MAFAVFALGRVGFEFEFVLASATVVLPGTFLIRPPRRVLGVVVVGVSNDGRFPSTALLFGVGKTWGVLMISGIVGFDGIPGARYPGGNVD